MSEYGLHDSIEFIIQGHLCSHGQTRSTQTYTHTFPKQLARVTSKNSSHNYAIVFVAMVIYVQI